MEKVRYNKMKLNNYTPIEQLYNFYLNNPAARGGVFTRELFFEYLTVEEHDKFWVFEKLLKRDVLKRSSILLGDNESYMVSNGVDFTLRWMIEKNMQKVV
jgi:hypothetical protein